jgi:hypothetical protein
VRKIILFISGLLLIFLYSSQVEAKGYDKCKRFSLWLDVGHTVPSNDELKSVTGGGKTSFRGGIEYCLARSYFSPSFGFQLSKLPLDRKGVLYFVDPGGLKNEPYTEDWDWTTGIIYLKVEMDKDILTPFIKAGTGIYHLDLDIPSYTGIKDISKYYIGFNMGFGLALNFRNNSPFSVYAEIEDNIIPISPSINLPEFKKAKSCQIINPKLGVGFRF